MGTLIIVICLFIIGFLLLSIICTIEGLLITLKEQQSIIEEILKEQVKINNFINNELHFYIHKKMYNTEPWE